MADHLTEYTKNCLCVKKSESVQEKYALFEYNNEMKNATPLWLDKTSFHRRNLWLPFGPDQPSKCRETAKSAKRKQYLRSRNHTHY